MIAIATRAWVCAALLCSGCLGSRDELDRETPSFFGRTIRVALSNGDIDRAEDAANRGIARYPRNGALLAWKALLAQMRWRDARSLSFLGQLRDAEADLGVENAELLGRIGDVLFRSGSYADSVAFLKAGGAGQHAARRSALVELAKELPYSRHQPRELAAELPLLEGPLPELLCTIGDRQRPFVLDTGASFTALTRTVAEELGVAPIIDAGVALDGAGRELPVSVGVLQSLSLGAVELDSQPVVVVADEALGLRGPFGGSMQTPKGVVGLDILARFRVTFDPARRSVLFELSRGIEVPRTVDCVQYDGRCLVPIYVEGRKLWFILDTGASHSSLTDEGLDSLPGAVQRARVSYRRVRTPGGESVAVRQVEALSIEVSAVRFDGVTLSVVARTGARLFPIHGVLGADLVTRCRTTFDDGRLLLEGL